MSGPRDELNGYQYQQRRQAEEDRRHAEVNKLLRDWYSSDVFYYRGRFDPPAANPGTETGDEHAHQRPQDE